MALISPPSIVYFCFRGFKFTQDSWCACNFWKLKRDIKPKSYARWGSNGSQLCLFFCSRRSAFLRLDGLQTRKLGQSPYTSFLSGTLAGWGPTAFARSAGFMITYSNPFWLKSIRQAADSNPRTSIRKASGMTTRPEGILYGNRYMVIGIFKP